MNEPVNISTGLRSRRKASMKIQSVTLTVEDKRRESGMKITLPVSRFKQILKALGGVCNVRAVEPSYRYVGLRATKEGIVDFVACNVEMMGRARFDNHPEITIDGLGDEVPVETLMVDSQLFTLLVDTLDPSSSISLEKDAEKKAINVVSGSHESEQSFNFDVRYEDFHDFDTFGGDLEDDEAKWVKFPLHLSPLLGQVEFCMPKDFQTDDYWLSGVRLSLKRARVDEGHPEDGTWVQMQTTDMYRFAHFRFRHDAELPEAELLIDHSIVAQVDRLDFTDFAYNKKAFCFYGGDSGVILYTRALGSPSKFPDLNKVFEEFRKGKKPEVLQIERDKLRPLLKRQCLFADQTDALLYSDLAIDAKNNVLGWAADNRISRGRDELSFNAVSDNVSSQKLTVNPSAMLNYADRTLYSILHMLIAKQGNKVFLALCPDVKAAEVQAPADPSKALPGGEDSSEGESIDSKSPAPLLGSLANSEFLYVTGAKAAK